MRRPTPLSRRTLLARAAVVATAGVWPRRTSPGGAATGAAPALANATRAGRLAAAAAERATIFIAPDDHTDYFWTADDTTYARVFVETLDHYLDAIDSSERRGDPPDVQPRWNCDGWLWVREYALARDEAAFARLVARIRDGHISVPLNALVLVQGGAPLEAVLRGMAYAGQLERRHGLRLPLAVAMENQTLPYGLGSLWAGAGARYSWKGICNCSTRLAAPGDRPHDIYWWVGPDGQRILMKWHSLIGGNDGSGGYAEIRHVRAAIEQVTPGTGDPRFRERYPFDIIGLFGQGWDDLETRSDAAPAAAQDLSDARRRVVVSNEVDFFTTFEARYGAGIPDEGVAYGNEWDLLIASMNEASARVRRAVERLRAAEAMAAVAGLAAAPAGAALGDRAADRDRCFGNLGLYYEHDWTADGRFARDVRAAWQLRLVDEIEAYVEPLHADAAAALGAQIGRGASPSGGRDVERWFVFNPLGWSRTDVVDLPLGGGPRPARVVDVASGAVVPSQWVTTPLDGATAVGAGPWLRVVVADVPAVGYRVVEIRPEGPLPWPATVERRGEFLINDHFEVRLAFPTGGIAGIRARDHGNRDLVAPGERLAALTGADGGDGQPLADDGAVADGPVSATARWALGSPRPHAVACTLHRGLARIDIDARIYGTFHETLAWHFPFRIPDPVVWHEEVGAIVAARPTTDGGHYHPTNARTDWLTFNHFAAVAPRGGDGPCVVLANRDSAFFRLGGSTVDRLDTASATLRALAGGQVDGPNLGIPDQGGCQRHHYRFAIAAFDRFRADAAMRFALEVSNPLVAAPVTGTTGGRPADRWGLLSVSDPAVLLWALKAADDGPADRLTVRLWNLAERPATPLVRVAPPYALRDAVRTTHIETPIAPEGLRDGALPAELRQAELGTWQLTLGRPARGSAQVIWLPALDNGG